MEKKIVPGKVRKQFLIPLKQSLHSKPWKSFHYLRVAANLRLHHCTTLLKELPLIHELKPSGTLLEEEQEEGGGGGEGIVFIVYLYHKNNINLNWCVESYESRGQLVVLPGTVCLGAGCHHQRALYFLTLSTSLLVNFKTAAIALSINCRDSASELIMYFSTTFFRYSKFSPSRETFRRCLKAHQAIKSHSNTIYWPCELKLNSAFMDVSVCLHVFA